MCNVYVLCYLIKLSHNNSIRSNEFKIHTPCNMIIKFKKKTMLKLIIIEVMIIYQNFFFVDCLVVVYIMIEL